MTGEPIAAGAYWVIDYDAVTREVSRAIHEVEGDGEGGDELLAAIEVIDVEALDLLVGDRLHRVSPYGTVRVERLVRYGFVLEVHGTSKGCPARETTVLLGLDECVRVSRAFREGEPIHARSSVRPAREADA